MWPLLAQKGCYRKMDTKMSQKTREEVLAQLRRRYAQAGKIGKTKLIDQAVELFGYHRKAAIRALGRAAPRRAPAVRTGRPKTYEPEALLKPLKAILAGGRSNPAAFLSRPLCATGGRPPRRIILAWPPR